MKVLLVGGGGREHALAWKLAQSPRLTRLYAAPGNPGIAAHADCVPVRDTDLDGLVALARRERVELAVIGPEVPLSLGLRDRLSDAGVPVFGPSQSAARLESSKAFAKDLMARYGIPTARFRVFQDADAARRFCRELGAPLVIKADGLAAGKGAMVCATLPEADAAIRLCLDEDAFGAAGRTVVVEEFMTGEEASFFVITDGASVLPLPAAQDHKAIFDDDRGPNTGGMGAYTPAPVMDEAMTGRVMEEIVTPTLAAMAKEGAPYAGVLFVGRPARRGVQLSLRRSRVSGHPAPPRRGHPSRLRGRGLRARAARLPALAARGFRLRRARLPGLSRDTTRRASHRGRGGGGRASGRQCLPCRHRAPRRRSPHRGRESPGRADARGRHPGGHGAGL